MHAYTTANLGEDAHIQKAASALKDSQVSGSSSEVQKDINTHTHTHHYSESVSVDEITTLSVALKTPPVRA